VADLTERVAMLADDAQPHDENRKLAKHLYAEKEALFTFLTHDGVDATNWRAEQAIRPAVVNRKVWAEQDLAGSRHPSKDDEPHPHRRPAEPRRDRVPHTPRPGTTPEDVPPLFA